MKNILLIITTFLISSMAMTQSDSVAVFHRPEKVIILINEGESGRRLSDMMDFLSAGNYFEVFSQDQNIKITCARNEVAASCTFRFFPGTNIAITSKKLEAKSTLANLNLEASGNFNFYFESSMQDKFTLTINNEGITFSASKKNLPN